MEKIYDENNKIIVPIYKYVDENIQFLNEILDKCDDMVKKEFYVNRDKQ